jgi:hypothetical protein
LTRGQWLQTTFSSNARFNLPLLEYTTLTHYQHALEALKTSIELFPEDSFTHGLPKQAESSQAAR